MKTYRILNKILVSTVAVMLVLSGCGRTDNESDSLSGTMATDASEAVTESESVKDPVIIEQTYFPVLPTGSEEADIFVNKVEGLSDDFFPKKSHRWTPKTLNDELYFSNSLSSIESPNNSFFILSAWFLMSFGCFSFLEPLLPVWFNGLPLAIAAFLTRQSLALSTCLRRPLKLPWALRAF